MVDECDAEIQNGEDVEPKRGTSDDIVKNEVTNQAKIRNSLM